MTGVSQGASPPAAAFAGNVAAPAAAAHSPAPSAPTPAPPTQLPGVASQLLSVLAPLRSTPIGVHTVTVVLHPESLGDVQATVTSHGGDVLVQLSASTPQGAAALRASLGDLSSGLQDGGQRAFVVFADSGDSGGRPTPRGRDATSTIGAITGPAPVSGSPAVTAASSGDTTRLLDVRL